MKLPTPDQVALVVAAAQNAPLQNMAHAEMLSNALRTVVDYFEAIAQAEKASTPPTGDVA